MKEKTRHRIGVFGESVTFLLIGAVGILYSHLKGAPLWFEVCLGAAFLILSAGVVLSVSFRRYIGNQSVSAYRYTEAELVGKYTILEDEFEQIRNACVEKMRKEYPRFSLREWHERKWEAVKDASHPEFACALFPGTFRDTLMEEKISSSANGSGDVCVGACVVAFWNGQAWEPTSFFVLGNETEAIAEMNTIMRDSYHMR